jgi:bifunctional ADP-heptose synthase (sugar kinase/adenylyltransferase)
VFPLSFRTSALSSLESVSGVRAFRDDNPLAALEEIKPDIHVKGGSFEPDRADQERELVESWGGKLVFSPMVDGYSSTDYIASARES